MSDLADLVPGDEHSHAFVAVIRFVYGRQRPRKMMSPVANLAPAKIHPVRQAEQRLHWTTGASRIQVMGLLDLTEPKKDRRSDVDSNRRVGQ